MSGHEARINLFQHDRLELRFCTRTDRTLVSKESVLEQLATVDPSQCQRLTLAGGNPIEHPEFESIVRACTALELRDLALEIEPHFVASSETRDALVKLGVQTLFLVAGGMRRKVHETVQRAPETFREAMEGIRQACADTRLRVYVVMPLLQWNREDIVPLLDWTEHLDGKLDGFLLSLPVVRDVPAAFRSALLTQKEQSEIAERVFQSCSRRRVEYGFTDRRGISPCATSGRLDLFGSVFHDRVNYLKHAGDNESFVRVEACATCSLQQSCRGMEKEYIEQFGAVGLEPVSVDRSMSWKLRPLNKLEKREYRNVSPFENVVETHARSLLRINGHCNMACAFCFVDRTAPDFEYDDLCTQIDTMAKVSTNHIVLSGGEPTLHPRLVDLVRHAHSLGFGTIEIQSNGVKAADMEYARALADAGLNKITVSLHSTDPETSDEITRLPRAFAKTVQSMHNFRSLGVMTQVAHVITKANYKDLPQFVRYLRTEFPKETGHLSICFAIAQGISDLVFTWVIPTFTEIRPYMRDALDYCLETDVGFGGMLGQGGFPPCMLDGEMKYYERVLGFIYRSGDETKQFYKASKCSTCSFDPWCVGVRRSYFETYGDGEIKPFQAEIDAPLPGIAGQDTKPESREALVQLRRRPAMATAGK